MQKFKDIRSFFKNTTSTPEEITDDVAEITIKTKTTATKHHSTANPELYSVLPASSTSVAETNGSTEAVKIKVAEKKLHLELGTLETGPFRPQGNFPKTQFGNRQRSFSSKYYVAYSWLEYSLKEDKVFCFVCRQFSRGNVRDQNEKFTISGFDNWKKIKEATEKHEKSASHKQCATMFISYKHSIVSGSVHEKLVMQHTEEVVQNRDYLMKLIDIILCLVRQGLPLRGHREDVFKIDIPGLEAETLVIKNILQKKNTDITLATLKTEVKQEFTPNLYNLLQVSMGLPVSSAGCERSFSAMRRVKTWLRATMLQERFSNMALLNIENKVIKEKVSAQQVLNVFAEKNRKLKLI